MHIFAEIKFNVDRMKNFNLIKDFKINKLQNMAILLMTILMSQFSWGSCFLWVERVMQQLH